jgi:hypothetical protein
LSTLNHQLAWVSAIAPVSEPYVDQLSKYSVAEAWHVAVNFEPLPPASVSAKKLTRKETYGWKPQLQSGHPHLSRSVGEVELAQRLRSAGYKAYWIDNFGGAPSVWRVWASGIRQLPTWMQELDRKVRQHRLMDSYGTGGLPDVVAWNPSGDEVHFIKYKGPKDKVGESQDAWFRSALDLNLLPKTSYIVAKWEASPLDMLPLETTEAMAQLDGLAVCPIGRSRQVERPGRPLHRGR